MGDTNSCPLSYLLRKGCAMADNSIFGYKSFMVEKASYWQHADGSFWWRNPETDKIEPYNPKTHSGSPTQNVTAPDLFDASKLTIIPQSPLMSAMFAVRLLVNHIKSGIPPEKAFALTNKYIASVKDKKTPKDLIYMSTVFSMLGLDKLDKHISTEKPKEQEAIEPTASVQGDATYDKTMTYGFVDLKYRYLDKKYPYGNAVIEVKSQDGNKTEEAVVSKYTSEAQTIAAHLANRIYQVYSPKQHFANPDLGTTKLEDGSTVLLMRPYQDVKNFHNLDEQEMKHLKNDVKSNFIIDAWLANWNIMGNAGTNIGFDTNNYRALRYTTGACLGFRANGESKGDAFGDTVTEVHTLRDPKISPTSAPFYKDLTDSEIIEQINNFESIIKEDSVSGLMSYINESGIQGEEAQALFTKLTNRAYSLFKYRDELVAKQKEEAIKKFGKPLSNYNDLYEGARTSYEDLPYEEKAMIQKYTASGFVKINKELLKKKWTKEGKILSSALAKMPHFNGLSFRGVGDYTNATEHFEKWKSGEWATCSWKAFTSTSIDPESAWTTSGSNSLAFTVINKGIKGGYLGPVSDHPSEHELLIDANSKYRVVGVCERLSEDSYSGIAPFVKCVILEEVSDKEYKKLPDKQSPPKKWSYNEYVAFVKENHSFKK